MILYSCCFVATIRSDDRQRQYRPGFRIARTTLQSSTVVSINDNNRRPNNPSLFLLRAALNEPQLPQSPGCSSAGVLFHTNTNTNLTTNPVQQSPFTSHIRHMDKVSKRSEFCVFMLDKMLLKVENTLLRSHRQRETTGIKKLYNSFFVMF